MGVSYTEPAGPCQGLRPGLGFGFFYLSVDHGINALIYQQIFF